MIVNLKEILDYAEDYNCAIGSFSCYNYETIKGALDAAFFNNMPVIIALGENYLDNIDMYVFASLVKSLAEELDIMVCIHLDHANNIENIKKAMNSGFTSVMYDGSMLEFKENMQNTKKIVDMAHILNISVEAELGSLALGDHSNEHEAEERYTNPKEAIEFVSFTNVDALAVSIGTVHGMYKGEANINLNVLKEINYSIDKPLVLHGGSGTPEEKLKECINLGIRKINVNTEISYNILKDLREELSKKENIHYSDLSMIARKSACKTVNDYIEIFKN